MGVSTTKKVLVSRFDRDTWSGFRQSTRLSFAANGLELMTQSGSVVSMVPYDEVKLVCFVRDFQQGEPRKELQLVHHAAQVGRPVAADVFSGWGIRRGRNPFLNNLLQLDSFGFSVVPPDPGFQNQRIFVPRAALSRMEVLGVVGSPLRTPRKPKLTPKEQTRTILIRCFSD